jgi:hypothetical protein
VARKPKPEEITMSALTDRAKAVLDNLKGSTFAGARALEIAQHFNNDDTAANDVTAQLFLDTLAGIVRSTVKSHRQQFKAAQNEAGEVEFGDDAVIDL